MGLKVDTAEEKVGTLGLGVFGRRASLRPTAYAICAAQKQITDESGKRKESRENWTLPPIPESERNIVVGDGAACRFRGGRRPGRAPRPSAFTSAWRSTEQDHIAGPNFGHLLLVPIRI